MNPHLIGNSHVFLWFLTDDWSKIPGFSSAVSAGDCRMADGRPWPPWAPGSPNRCCASSEPPVNCLEKWNIYGKLWKKIALCKSKHQQSILSHCIIGFPRILRLLCPYASNRYMNQIPRWNDVGHCNWCTKLFYKKKAESRKHMVSIWLACVTHSGVQQLQAHRDKKRNHSQSQAIITGW